jgi:hypothetical protein
MFGDFRGKEIGEKGARNPFGGAGVPYKEKFQTVLHAWLSAASVILVANRYQLTALGGLYAM